MTLARRLGLAGTGQEPSEVVSPEEFELLMTAEENGKKTKKLLWVGAALIAGYALLRFWR